MERCASCGSKLPDSAQFCGYCGHVVITIRELPTNMVGNTAVSVLEDDTPTTISGASHTVLSSGEHWDSAARYARPAVEMSAYISEEEEEDDEEDRVLFGLPLSGTQSPSATTPMAQGTPQMGGVPMVQGNPDGLFAVPTSAGAASFAPTPAPLAPAPASHTPPPQPAPLPHTGSWSPTHHTGSSTHPSPPPKHSGTGSGSSRPAPGGSCALVALILAIICLIIVGIIGGLFFAIIPAMSVVGSSSVTTGEGLHLHGYHFFPGSSITLTLDNRLQLFSAAGSTTDQAHSQGPSAAALQVMVADQLASPNTDIKADGSGSFDVTIPVNPLWSIGPHSIRATESFGSRSTVVNFTVVGVAAKMVAQPTTLDFGKLELGNKAVLSVVVNNNGGQPLNWRASSGGATWLQLAPGTGTLQAGASPQFIYVTGDTSQLKVGTYSATLTISSNGGRAQVNVSLQVVPQSPKPQAKINVAPNTLNFGTLDVGQQLTKAVTVSNTGNLALHWKANTGDAHWVTLDTSSQTIQPAGLPDTVNVTVDTTNLPSGSHSTTLTLSSNGGSAQVAITVVVKQHTQTSQPCTLQAPSLSNASFSAKMGSNPAAQTFTIGVSGSCSDGVTITPNVTLGSSWLAVSPPSATITSGSVAFTINVTSSSLSPGTYSGSISLVATMDNNTINSSPQIISVTLTVTEVPPVLAVSPTSLTYSLSNGDSTVAEAFTISNTGGAPLNWTAALDAKAPSFVSFSSSASLSSASGKNLATNTSVKVYVNPYAATAGNYTATVTVSAIDPITGQSVQGSPATVSLTITITSAMQLNPISISFTPSSCTYTASGTVVVTNTGGSTLTWSIADPVYGSGQPSGWLTVTSASNSASAGGTANLTFSGDGSSSQLVSGQTYTATVTITPSVGDPQTVSVSFTVPSCIQ